MEKYEIDEGKKGRRDGKERRMNGGKEGREKHRMQIGF